VQGLQARGYTDLRSTHTTLLSNINLAGSSVSMAADRAGITKQAMGRLAAELADAGYITIDNDPKDARARLLRLTKRGQALMLDSFDLMADLERRYARTLGGDRFATVLAGLTTFVDIADGS
jgi:DNA-binding MarR family transcriptional regulator